MILEKYLNKIEFSSYEEFRSDFKIMGNFLLQRVEPLKEFILPVNPS